MISRSFLIPLNVLSLALCFTSLPTQSQAINTLTNLDFTAKIQSQNKQSQSNEVGLEMIGSPNFNQLVIPMYRYTGECPGFSKGSVRASFSSSAIPPNKNMRVVVKNISRGLASDPFPFTDREYNRGRNSETFVITTGPGHDQRFLIVREGSNDFQYEIKDGNTVVDQGIFSAYIQTQMNEIVSNKEPRQKRVCPNNRTSCKWKEMYEVTVYECPSHPDVL
jgi:hypothetical protein